MSHRDNHRDQDDSPRYRDTSPPRPSAHRAPHGTTTTSPNSEVDRVADYVARQLLPTVMRSSDRPVNLVLNFGHLKLADGDPSISGSTGPIRPGRSSWSVPPDKNTLTYYHSGDYPLPDHHGQYHPGTGFRGGRYARARAAAGMAATAGFPPVGRSGVGQPRRSRYRTVGVCLVCLEEQPIDDASGYCRDCDLLFGSSGLPADREWERERELERWRRYGVSYGDGHDGLSEVSYAHVPVRKWGRRRIRDRGRDRDQAELERRLRERFYGYGEGGYTCSDSDTGMW